MRNKSVLPFKMFEDRGHYHETTSVKAQTSNKFLEKYLLGSPGLKCDFSSNVTHTNPVQQCLSNISEKVLE